MRFSSFWEKWNTFWSDFQKMKKDLYHIEEDFSVQVKKKLVEKTLGDFSMTKWLEIAILSSCFNCVEKGKGCRRADIRKDKGISNKEKQHAFITDIVVNEELKLLLIMLPWKKWRIDLEMITSYYQ